MIPHRTYLPWLLLLLLISFLQLSGLYTALRLPLEQFPAHKLYTLFTAHIVHINLNHYTHNAFALLIIMLLVAPAFTWRDWLLTCLVSSLTISLLLLFWPANFSNYAGLSGLLHGLFVAGCLGMLRRSKALAVMLMLLLAGKLMAELIFDVRLLYDVNFSVVSHAHLFGALGGLLSTTANYLLRKQAQD